MSRAYIVGIQEELLAHGYYVGSVDGIVGKRTKGAIRQYQRDAGLSVDGVATKELLDHLKFAIPKVYARGTATSSTPLVSEIQVELQRRGYYQGRVDGLVGPLTRSAVASFQRDAGLAVTGSVGSGVLNDLRAADPSIRAN
jgi:peptidoglycan hydrolase-like protein with peptidoglycan-binding domain